jgi:hypothetical protein
MEFFVYNHIIMFYILVLFTLFMIQNFLKSLPCVIDIDVAIEDGCRTIN